MSSTGPKQSIYKSLSEVPQALGHPHRLELLEHLALGVRSVEVLSTRARLSFVNTSRHLGIRRRARLVDTERHGEHILYRLAGDTELIALIKALGRVGGRNLAGINRAMMDYLRAHDSSPCRGTISSRGFMKARSPCSTCGPRMSSSSGISPAHSISRSPNWSVAWASRRRNATALPHDGRICACCRCQAVARLSRRGTARPYRRRRPCRREHRLCARPLLDRPARFRRLPDPGQDRGPMADHRQGLSDHRAGDIGRKFSFRSRPLVHTKAYAAAVNGRRLRTVATGI